MKLDFEKLGAGIQKAFKKYAQDEFLSVGEPSAVKTTAGIKYKEVDVLFKDGQVVTMKVKSTGDVYQVLVNGRLQPIVNQDDDKNGVSEILSILEKSRSAFQKKQAKQKVALPNSIKTTAPTMQVALTAKIEQLDKDIQAAKRELGLVE